MTKVNALVRLVVAIVPKNNWFLAWLVLVPKPGVSSMKTQIVEPELQEIYHHTVEICIPGLSGIPPLGITLLPSGPKYISIASTKASLFSINVPTVQCVYFYKYWCRKS